MMRLTEEVLALLATTLNGTTKVTLAGGGEVDLAPPWRRIDLREALIQHAGLDFTQYFGRREELVQFMERRGTISATNAFMRHKASWGRLLDKLISDAVEPQLTEPCFLVDYPLETTPFAKRKPGSDGVVERAEAFIGGVEVANMFTELNDPVDQRERMLEQERIRQQFGDEESDRLDEDFREAMDYCMPPAGGVGIGIDRIVMLLTGTESIGDVLLFPALYKAAGGDKEQG